MQWNGLKDRPLPPATHSASSSLSIPPQRPPSTSPSSSSSPFLSLAKSAKSPFRKTQSARSSPTTHHPLPLGLSSGIEQLKVDQEEEDVVEIGFAGNTDTPRINPVTLGGPITAPLAPINQVMSSAAVPRTSSLRPAPPPPTDSFNSIPPPPHKSTSTPNDSQEETSLALADQSAGSDDLGTRRGVSRSRRRSDQRLRQGTETLGPQVSARSSENGTDREGPPTANGNGIKPTEPLRMRRPTNDSLSSTPPPLPTTSSSTSKIAPDRISSRNAVIPSSKSTPEASAAATSSKEDPPPPPRRSGDSKPTLGSSSKRRSLRSTKHRTSQGDPEADGDQEAQERRERRKAQAGVGGSAGVKGGEDVEGDAKHTRSSRTLRKRNGDKDRDRGAREAVSPTLPNAKVGVAPKAAMYFSAIPYHGFPPPQPLRAHTATLVGHHIYVIGGTDTRECWNGIARFNTETYAWNVITTAGIKLPKLRAHSATLVGKLIYVLMGGDGGSYSNGGWVFDTETNRLTKPNITTPKESWPLARRAHSAVLYKNYIVIFGGGNGSAALNDVWALDVSDSTALRWSEWKGRGDLPPPKGYHTATLVGEKLLVYGGSDGTSSFSDVHILNLGTMSWTLVDTEQKYSRLSHTATQVGSALFCIGGHDGNKYAQEVLLLNLVTLAWEKKPIYGQFPAGRGYHTCCLTDSRIFCLMGYNGQTVFNDVWCLDLAASAYLPQVTAFQIDETLHQHVEGYTTDQG